jgi:hypothetical protein
MKKIIDVYNTMDDDSIISLITDWLEEKGMMKRNDYGGASPTKEFKLIVEIAE